MRDHMLPVQELIDVGRAFHARSWILPTAGSFSAVVSRLPFQMAITKSGVHKGTLTSSDFVVLDQFGRPLEAGSGAPAEAPIHCSIASEVAAGAVLHTHSVWATILADIYAESNGVQLEGFEELQGLSPGMSHRHVEWLPILQNASYGSLAASITRTLKAHTATHAVLVQKHGLYAWGATIEEAVRCTEVFETLLEVFVRKLHILSQLDLKAHGAC
jgi:methylthioribulose-1-phosphate dehydratase